MTRRRLAALAALLGALALLAGLAVLQPAAVSADDSDPSSRSAGSMGTLALYSWLGDLGLDVYRLSGGWSLDGADVLVVAAPRNPFSDEEVATTQRFLARGGELVLTLDSVGAQPAAALLQHLGVDIVGAGPGGEAASAGSAPPGALRVPMAEPTLRLGGAAPLLQLDSETVGVAAAVGAGRAVVLGSERPLDNEGLRTSRPNASGGLRPTGSDAYRLALSLLERAHPAHGRILRVAFDEVHHGEGSGGVSAVLLTPVGLAALLAALVAVAYLAGSGRRLGRAVPAEDPTRVPSAADFVGAMAALYERSARRGSIAARYAAELKERVGAGAGVEAGLDDAAFVAGLRPWGIDSAGAVAALLARARDLAAASPSEAELLDLARRVDAAEARWSVGAPL